MVKRTIPFNFIMPISMKKEIEAISKDMKKDQSFIARKSLTMFIKSFKKNKGLI